MPSWIVLLLVRTTAAADPVDHARAAIYLAQHGQCDSARQYAELVAHDDPDYYERTLAHQPDLARCMPQTASLGAQPLAPQFDPAAIVIHERTKCRSWVYGEPSLFVG